MGRAYQNRKDSIAKTSNQKARVYSRYGREIYVAAKSGGTDPAGNLTLRGLIERARKDQVPSHVIDKAIDKAKGAGGEDFAVARYEGFGPGGCTVIIECLTDNPNRTSAEVRNCFGKVKCKIGVQGSVSHMFDHCAILAFDRDNEDEVLEALMERDVDVSDIESEAGRVTVFAASTDYSRARQALIEAFGEIDFELDEIQFVPQNTVGLSGDDQLLFERFLELLDDVDDVQRVFHNVE
ncbi:MAG: YebC/PmpR family DNA-binding transcriptional regulator [Gammaproteobacteria bacterium]|nr:YebC/PmpR family DNA-binding transcriptional regulator [Gammaproteobacteria bacterium]